MGLENNVTGLGQLNHRSTGRCDCAIRVDQLVLSSSRNVPHSNYAPMSPPPYEEATLPGKDFISPFLGKFLSPFEDVERRNGPSLQPVESLGVCATSRGSHFAGPWQSNGGAKGSQSRRSTKEETGRDDTA